MNLAKRKALMTTAFLILLGSVAFFIGARAARKANSNNPQLTAQTRKLPKVKNLTKSLEVVNTELLDQDTLLLSLRNVSSQEIGAYTIKLGTQLITTHGSINTRHSTAIAPGEIVTERVMLDSLGPNDDVKIVAVEVGDSYEGDEEGKFTIKSVRDHLQQVEKGQDE
jgi:hypothetical protein